MLFTHTHCSRFCLYLDGQKLFFFVVSTVVPTFRYDNGCFTNNFFHDLVTSVDRPAQAQHNPIRYIVPFYTAKSLQAEYYSTALQRITRNSSFPLRINYLHNDQDSATRHGGIFGSNSFCILRNHFNCSCSRSSFSTERRRVDYISIHTSIRATISSTETATGRAPAIETTAATKCKIFILDQRPRNKSSPWGTKHRKH